MRNRKKQVLTAAAAGLAGLVLFGASPALADTELIVFAAASLTESLEEIKALYEEENPDVQVIYNFDSSGTLKTQIEEGADCDVFISASPKQMDQLDVRSGEDINPDGLDFVLEESRTDLLENKVVLAVAADDEGEAGSFDELAELLADGDVLLAMGNADVPVGQYTQKILAYYGLDEQQLAADGKITYGSNVKEVTTQVSQGSVDCGVVYSTDAFSAGLTVIDTATEEMCGQVIYPAAVLKTSEKQEEAQAYLSFLRGEVSSQIFEKIGFTPIESEE